ncbi:MAG: c-type cytochrome [Candidatus Margulisiibacteriota bacterium]
MKVLKSKIGILILLIGALLCLQTATEAGLGSAYLKQCSLCHGAQGEGGLGPKLVKTALPYGKFIDTVRSGKGMMPAISKGAVSDKGAKKIYDELAEIEGNAASSGPVNIIAGMLARNNVVLSVHLSLILMILGFIYVTFTKYLAWAGFNYGKKYYSKLGFFKIVSIIIKTGFMDTISVSPLLKRDALRWVIHGLMIYGFFGLILADILIAICNPQRIPMAFLSPFKILANISGLLVLIGLTIVVYRMFSDKYENNGVTFRRDIIFVAIICTVALSGFATEAAHYLGFPQYTLYSYFVHIFSILILFITAPFTRFEHVVSTFMLVLNTRLSEAVSESGRALGFIEEPAPGRHHKTEKIADDLLQTLPGKTNYRAVRYFP